jgi:predicted Zn-dependent protease
MHTWWRRLGLVAAVVLVVSSWAHRGSAQSVGEASQLMSKWQFEEADRIVDALASSQPDAPAVQYLQARSDFMRGNYDRSFQRMEQLLTNGPTSSGERWKQFRNLVGATRDVTKDYEKHVSPEGRFHIYVEPGKDRVLVPYAARALERAYEGIGEELGYKPETPIRVEVYPRTSTLAKVSGLTEEDIRTSGTIALCKYNRLMITSPKALLRGYEWVDTLVHEYVHYVINHKTANQVPIWMHEGIAKFLERRWRGPNAHRLPPSNEKLLQKRLEADDLVTFEQMHPSMAKLPSQEDAATAFAEVYTVMEYLQKEVGETAIRDVLEAIPEGGGAKGAIEVVTGRSFDAFQRRWKAYLRERETPELPDESEYSNKLVFKDEADQSETRSFEELDAPEAKEHLKIGDMLQARKRYEAAAVQYRRASRQSKRPNPRLQTELARALTETDRPEEAIEALERVRKLYPSYLAIRVELGRAHLAADEADAARDHLLEAVWTNPFDPAVHEMLADAYEQLGESEEAEQERKFAKML